MENNNYSLIGPEQLDIDAISDYVVSSKKLVYRSGDEETTKNKAQDVDKVSGVLAEYIAVVPDKNDRTTVTNALKLGGKDATEYMTEMSGASLRTKHTLMKNLYGEEIIDLKDELYQLRQELAKGGIIEDRGQYHGYSDLFRSGIIKHIDGIYVEATIANGYTLNNVSSTKKDALLITDAGKMAELNPYDYIVVENPATNIFQIKQIKAKEGSAIILDSEINLALTNEKVNVYLSKGFVQDGMFKFANKPEQQEGSIENHTGLSDDTYRSVQNITAPNTGFGYSFRIPQEKQGYVTSFEISVAAKGAPGALICYLIDSRDIDKFANPAQAEAAYQKAKSEGTDDFHFFAKSKPMYVNSAEGRRYKSFDFMQSDGTYPIMSMDSDETTVRYVAIIESQTCDSNNYCIVTFLSYKKDGNSQAEDLEKNNIVYDYERKKDDKNFTALTASGTLNVSDMYYHITTRNVVENEAEAQKEGLYSFKTSVKDTSFGNIARVVMRIKREGMYATSIVETTSTVYPHDGKPTIKLTNKDENNGIKTIEELRLKTDVYCPLENRSSSTDISQTSKTIIGGNVVIVNGIQNDEIAIDRFALINNDDPVYRMGYIVSLKARKSTFDEKTGTIEKTEYDHFNLPLTRIFRDFSSYDKEVSDRLIFEAPLQLTNQELKQYNEFMVQVCWSNPELSTYPDIKKSQMGAIKDIVFSVDKGF